MANGNFAGGDGTTENPYLIEDAWDLDAVRNDLTASYKLIADIDLDISPFNEGEGWTPIGDNSTSSDASRFSGSFDGNNKAIFNLFINRPGSRWQGLFGYTISSTIKNIGLESIDITGSGNTGGLVGSHYNSSVIVNSYSTGNITGGSRTGGLVGYNFSSSIYNSCSTSTVTGKINYTGGLVGHNNASTIFSCYSTGNVNGNGGEYTGGLVGHNHQRSTISNSYSIGSVTSNIYAGGLIGTNVLSTVTNSFWDVETSGQTTSSGGIGLITQEMQTAQTFIDAGWHEETLEDGTLVWILNDGQYPKLWFEKANHKYLIEDNGEIKKWNKESQTFQTIGPSPATESQFLEEGMDSLEELNILVTSLSAPLISDGTLGEGNIYKATIHKKEMTISGRGEVKQDG